MDRPASGGEDGRRPGMRQADAIKAALKAEHPGWDIWYVYGAGGSIKWCGRPKPLLNRETPEALSAAIKAAENGSPAVAPLRAV